jgi:RNA polymerase sigma factor (TIGR02999 family)
MSIPDVQTYSELKSIAKSILKRERRIESMSSVDLFHEAYCRLNDYLCNPENEVQDLKALFAQTMRRVIVDQARKRTRRERRLPRILLDLDQQPDHYELKENLDRAETLILLDQALSRLAIDYPTHAKVVELKYFGGLTIHQCAQQLNVSTPTIERYWAFARKWLANEVRHIAGLAD